MATSKTLNPTNVSISIPALGDAPDASVFSNCIDKEADAINALNSQLAVTVGQCTKVKNDLTFGSQNIVYKFGRIAFVTVVFTLDTNANQNDVLFTVPYNIRYPVLANIRRDAGGGGGVFLFGTDIENTANVKALFGEGLPAGIYRGTFVYLTALTT